jgi:hypothetical protein
MKCGKYFFICYGIWCCYSDSVFGGVPIDITQINGEKEILTLLD